MHADMALFACRQPLLHRNFSLDCIHAVRRAVVVLPLASDSSTSVRCTGAALLAAAGANLLLLAPELLLKGEGLILRTFPCKPMDHTSHAEKTFVSSQ